MNGTKECFTLLIALLLTMLCSCGRNEKIMDEAERIVEQSPDSSLALLSTVDRYSLSKSDRARYGLLFTMAQDKSGVDVDMDTLIRQSYIYYKGEPETKYYGLSQYYMGKYYFLNDSTTQCEECFRNVINNAKERGDIDLQCLALEKLSRSIVLSNTKQSIEYARQGVALYKTSKTRKLANIVSYTLNLAFCFAMDDQKDSAFTYLRQAKGMLNNKIDKEVIADVYHIYSGVYNYFNETDSALYYSRKALEVMHNDKLQIFHAFCLQKCDSLEAAEKILRDCVKRCGNQQKYTIYMDICKMSGGRLFDKQHSDDIDSLDKYTKMYMLDLYSYKGQYFEKNIRQGRELERMKTSVLLRNYTILFVVVFVVFIAAIVYMQYSKRKAIQEQEALFLKKQHELLVESKNKQIALMKNSLFEKLDLAHKIKDARNNKCHIIVSDNDWGQLYAILEGGDDRFVSRLRDRYPNLNDEDLHLCMLIKIGLSNEDISNIYCISSDSIKKKLYCFKEKLNITDRGVSLREYIKNY